MPKPPFLSIIIPAYQEAKRIESTLDALASYLDDHNASQTEVVVVTAGSADGTARLAQNKGALFRHFKFVAAGSRVGKGRDVRLGMLAASGEYRLFMDADLATPLHHIEEFIAAAQRGAPVVIAMRDLTLSHTGLRRWLSGSGNMLVQALLLPGIQDSQCGFKMFSAAATEEIFRRQTILGWGFDMEILAITRSLRYPIETIAVDDWTDKPHGAFEDNMFVAAISTLGELMFIWWRRLRGAYREPSFHDTVE